jgi:hypothetical protein
MHKNVVIAGYLRSPFDFAGKGGSPASARTTSRPR